MPQSQGIYKKFGALILTLTFTICVFSRIIFSPTPSSSPTAHVISFVHDGDTVYTRNLKPAIRLIGIDAPELAGSYRCGKDANCTETVEESGATAAKEKLKELVLDREVILEEDKTLGSTDKYNRWLRYVYLCKGEARLARQVPSPNGRPAYRQGRRDAAPTTNLSSTNSSCLDINLQLIRLGFVHEAGFGNAYEKQNAYRAAELEAKTKKLGIWK